MCCWISCPFAPLTVFSSYSTIIGLYYYSSQGRTVHSVHAHVCLQKWFPFPKLETQAQSAILHANASSPGTPKILLTVITQHRDTKSNVRCQSPPIRVARSPGFSHIWCVIGLAAGSLGPLSYGECKRLWCVPSSPPMKAYDGLPSAHLSSFHGLS